MPKAGFIVARVSFLVLAASMLGVAMLAAPAAGQTSTCSSTTKCFFAVSVSPSHPTAGTSTSFTFTIQNEASPQQLGSVQISAPTGFMITSAPGATSFTSTSALFLNLSLASGSQTMLTVSATVPCGSGSYQWGIAAKQSNNFNGSGNDFQLDPKSAGNLSGTFTGSCTFQPCPPSTPCSASASSATTSGTVTTSSAVPPGDSIVTGMESANSNFNFSCGTNPPVYTPVSDVFGFAVFNASGIPQPITLTVTLRIDKSLVNSSGHPGASSWQICYGSTTAFNALLGTSQQNVTIGGNPGYFTGLLPDCSSTQGAPPCVQARNKNNAGDVIVTFLALGDPYGHG
jgi:Domain of unknown function DUF11